MKIPFRAVLKEIRRYEKKIIDRDARMLVLQDELGRLRRREAAWLEAAEHWTDNDFKESAVLRSLVSAAKQERAER